MDMRHMYLCPGRSYVNLSYKRLKAFLQQLLCGCRDLRFGGFVEILGRWLRLYASDLQPEILPYQVFREEL
jgi:hypothetical protein